MKGDVFQPNALVFAKIRGYPAWPARVTAALDEGKKPKKYSVFFFGTYEVATVKVDDLYAYDDQSREKFGSVNVKRKGFAEAMQEIEESPDLEPASPIPVIPKTTPKSATPKVATPRITGTPDSTPKPRGRGRKRKEDTPLEPVGKRRRQDSGDGAESAADGAEPQLSRSGRKIKPKRFADEEGRRKSTATTKRERAVVEPAEDDNPLVEKDPLELEVKQEHEPDEPDEPEAPLPMEDDVAGEDGGAGDELETAADHSSEAEHVEEHGDHGDHDTAEPPSEPEQPRRDVRYKPYPAHETEDIIRVVDSANVQQEDGRKVMLVKAKCGEMLEIDISDRERPDEFKSEKARIMWDTATTMNLRRLRHSIETGQCVPDRLRDKLLARADLADDVRTKLIKDKRDEMRKSKLWWLRDEARLIEIDYHIKLNLIIDQQNHDKCVECFQELVVMNMAPLMLKKNPDIVETTRKCRKYTNNGKIRELADKCYQRFKKMFVVPPGKMFREYFDEQVASFRKVTEEMDEAKVIVMVRDPLYSRPGDIESDPDDEDWPPQSADTNGTNGDVAADPAADPTSDPATDPATDKAAAEEREDDPSPQQDQTATDHSETGEVTEAGEKDATEPASPTAAAEPDQRHEPAADTPPPADEPMEEETAEETTEETAEEVAEETTEETAEEVAEETTEDVTEEITEETANKPAEEATKEPAEEPAEEAAVEAAEEAMTSSEEDAVLPTDKPEVEEASTNDEEADASSEEKLHDGESTTEESESAAQ